MGITPEQSLRIQEERKRQILDVALILFDQKGYRNTLITDIAQAAGISKGLVYRYFSSKSEILFAYLPIMSQCLTELANYESPKEAIREFGYRLFSHPNKESKYLPPLRVYIKTIILGELDASLPENLIITQIGKTFFEPLFKKGQELGEFRSGNPEEFADIYWHYLLGHLTHIIEDSNNHNYIPNLDAIVGLFENELY